MKGRNNSMKKSHLLILAGVLVLLVTMCIGISAEDTVVAKIGEKEYTSLNQAFTESVDGDTIMVTADTNLTAVVTISSKKITLQSEDENSIKTIKVGDFSNNQIKVSGTSASNPGSLTLKNIKITKPGTTINTNTCTNVEGLFTTSSYGDVIMEEGTTIYDTYAGNGGAVWIAGGRFIMNGGTIENCRSNWWSPITAYAGEFIMNGGTITGGSCGNNSNGSAVGTDARAGSKVTLNSGTITGNGSATSNKGAVYVKKGATLTISDNMVIKDNTGYSANTVDGAIVNLNVGGTSLIKAFDLIPAGDGVATVTLNNDLNITAAEDGTAEVESGKGYYAYDISNKKFVIEGSGKNINLNGNVYLRGLGSTAITLKNVTVLREKYGTFAIFDMKNTSVLNMEDGTTIGSDDFVTSGGNGAAVFLENTSTFNMKGGTIKNCKSASRAAIGVDSGTFNMTGGTITGCNGDSVTTPSVLIVSNGTANLTGGEIKDNGASQAGKGAVVLGSWDNKGTGKIVVNGTAITNVGMTPAVYKCSMDAAATLSVNADGLTYNETGKAWYENATLEKTVAFIGAYPFDTLRDAIGYWNLVSGDLTIELTKSFSEDMTKSTITINKKTKSVDNQTVDCVLTVNGNGNKVTVLAAKGDAVGYFLVNGKTVLNNVTFTRDVFTSYGLFKLSNYLIMDDGAVIEGVQGSVGSAIDIEGAGKLVMNEGSIIRNCSSTWVGSIWLNNTNAEVTINGGQLINNKGGNGVITATKGNVYLNGGEFSGNAVPAVVVCNANGASNATVHLSGDIKFTGNAKDIYFNLVEANNDKGTLVLDGDFTGNVKIEGTAYAASLLGNTGAYAAAGNTIGTVNNSATVKNIDSITSADGKLFARVSGGNLVWTAKPTLTMDTDTGKYTLSTDPEPAEGEEAKTYGVVRVITTAATDTDVDVKVFGTYFVKVAGGELTAKNSWEGANGKFTDGSGYIADLVDITEDATVYAISYYTIDGIEDMVKTDAKVIEYVAATAKDLGPDPADLNYE